MSPTKFDTASSCLNVRGIVFRNSCSIELEKPLAVGEKLISVRRLGLVISLITLSVKLLLDLCSSFHELFTNEGDLWKQQT